MHMLEVEGRANFVVCPIRILSMYLYLKQQWPVAMAPQAENLFVFNKFGLWAGWNTK